MCRKVICVASGVLLLSLAVNTSADLVGYWAFDEGSGDIAYDSSGNGNDGTLNGPEWVVGKSGGALSFNGQDNYVEVPTSGSLEIDTGVTIAAWINWIDAGDGWQTILTKGPMAGPGENYALFINRTGRYFHFVLALDVGRVQQNSPDNSVVADDWQHVCCTWDGSVTRIYIDGEMAVEIAQPAAIIPSDLPLRIGHRDGSSHYWSGIIDEVRVYDHAVSEAEVLGVMEGQPWPYAFGPSPADGAMYADTWATLSWKPGQLAVSHDVYLSDNFDDVNDSAEAAFQGNQASTMLITGFAGFAFPDGLVPGTTYYWRVDEVNDSEPNSPWRGDVWSFTVPPKTAYSPDPPDGAEFVDPNAIFTWTPGFGAKLHTVYMGTNFDDVDNAQGGAPIGFPSHSPAPLELEKVYYWRVDEFDAFETYKGDVWAFTTPGAVGNPQPANGAVDVQMTSTLSWTAAETAASHELYFGTDADAVGSATTASPEYVGPRALGAESYDPGGLAWHSSYAWRVDEVYPNETVKGLVWSFVTADFLLVDDFESYNDIDPPDPNSNRIFDKWIDGFGTTTNGALVGNDLPPYAEQNIIHGGAQSMPYRYDNAGKTSEATRTLVSNKDWTAHGVTKLALWFRGDSANAAERMFVVLGNAVVYHPDDAATQTGGWNEWIIDLQEFANLGANLSDVGSITLGFGTRGAPVATGGTGTVHFDDIWLVR